MFCAAGPNKAHYVRLTPASKYLLEGNCCCVTAGCGHVMKMHLGKRS